jgi:hypothetical protein
MYSLASVEMEPTNKEAHNLYKNDFNEYVKICKACVDKSQDLKLNNHPSSMLKFTHYTPAHDKIIDKIKQVSSDDVEPTESKEALKNWLINNFDQVVSQDPAE